MLEINVYLESEATSFFADTDLSFRLILWLLELDSGNLEVHGSHSVKDWLASV